MLALIVCVLVLWLGSWSWWHYHRHDDINPRMVSRVTRVLRRKGKEFKISRLSETDVQQKSWIAWGYRYDGLLDVDILERGLVEVLEIRPEVGGRIKGDKIIISPEDGVRWEVHVFKRSPKGTPLPDGSSHGGEWTKHGLMPKSTGRVFPPSANTFLAEFRVTIFLEERVTYVGLFMSHMLVDAHSRSQFMQLWSRMCLGVEDTEKDDNIVHFGVRVSEPLDPIKSKQELLSRFHPEWIQLDRHSFVKTVPRLLFTLLFQKSVEYRICASKVAAVKRQISKELLQPGEWISSYSVIMGHILWATQQGQARHTRHQIDAAVVVNFRGRVEAYPKSYFGNAVGHILAKHVIKTSPEETVVALSKRVGSKLTLGQTELHAQTDWRLSARNLGFEKELGNHIIGKCLRGERVVLTSSAKYDWFKPAGFCGITPSCYTSYAPVAIPGVVCVQPRTPNGDLTVLLSVPRSTPTLFDSVPFLERVKH